MIGFSTHTDGTEDNNSKKISALQHLKKSFKSRFSAFFVWEYLFVSVSLCLCSVYSCVCPHSIANLASGLNRTAARLVPSKDTRKYSDEIVNELVRFQRSTHFILKGIDFLSNITVFLFVYASHLPALHPAVWEYLCQTHEQSLQVTVLISALWLPMRFSRGLWEQLVCHCKQPDWNQGSLAWHESDLIPLCLVSTYSHGGAYHGTELVQGYLLFCCGKVFWPSGGVHGKNWILIKRNVTLVCSRPHMKDSFTANSITSVGLFCSLLQRLSHWGNTWLGRSALATSWQWFSSVPRWLWWAEW